MIRKTNRQRQRGQALVMLLAILGLVGALFAMSIIHRGDDTQAIAETNAALIEARNALVAYAASYSAVSTPAAIPHLPCPDITGDGVEDRNPAGACTAPGGATWVEGRLPWITLGISGLDAWGHRFRYSVTRDIANNNTAAPFGIRLATVGSLNIRDSSTVPMTNLALNAPFVIVSHGKNGWGATGRTGGVAPAPPGAYEQENTDGDNEFRANQLTSAPAGAGGEFDDILTWLTIDQIRTQLTTAGNPAQP